MSAQFPLSVHTQAPMLPLATSKTAAINTATSTTNTTTNDATLTASKTTAKKAALNKNIFKAEEGQNLPVKNKKCKGNGNMEVF